MDSITESYMASTIDSVGGLGIIHRYNSIQEQENLVHRCYVAGASNIGAAVGVTGDYRERAQTLVKAGANVICIDVAHGHHKLMRKCLELLRKDLGSNIHIMAGNVATLEGFNDLSDWGADSIRVGIGGGSICSTRLQTGHGIPTFQSIIDCSRSDRDSLLIADGGIKNSGDMVKALAAGADLLMCGSLLSGTNETPGKLIKKNGQLFKSFRGMGSVGAMNKGSADRYFQKKQKDSSKYVPEGVEGFVKYKGDVGSIIYKLIGGLKSSMGYLGSKTIIKLRNKPQFVKITKAGFYESMVHNVDVVKNDSKY